MSEAVLRALAPAFDLLAAYPGPEGFFFERSGLGIAASGIAGRVGASNSGEVREVLQRIGPGAVAVGSLPFDVAAGAELTLPATYCIRDETGAREYSALEPSPRRLPLAPIAPAPAFDEMQLTPRPDAGTYMAAVAEARDHIRAGELSKVVLARTLDVQAERDLDPKQLLWRLRAVDPDCFVFAAPGSEGVLVGASPELLASTSGRRVRANPLAGSAPRRGNPDQDRASASKLFASEKDRHEHHLVVEAVEEALSPLCEELSFPGEPQLLATANVWHLSTPFEGRLRPGVGGVLDVVSALHPTPAVCGTPRAEAAALIGELEPFDRGRYAGPVGWVDARGDGTFAIALRCALLLGAHARLFAGAGIVADSEPQKEAEETERKFKAFLDPLRWG